MNKAILALLLLATMLMAACSNSENTTTTTGFIGGQKGLDIAFYTGAPPETTADNGQQSFDVIVDVTNGGEDEVPADEVYVKLSGFSPETFGVGADALIKNPDDDIAANIKSADGAVIKSPTVSVPFEGFNYQETEVASRTFPIRAEICYQYQTKIAAELCVKENFNSNKDDDLCAVNAARSFSSSGAPVQITAITQSTAGTDKTRFTFTIQNMDTGKIYKLANGCNQSTSNENKVHVEITGLTDETGAVKCVGLMDGTDAEGYVTLASGESRDVSCTVTMSSRNNRIEPFEIDLAYDYWKYIDTSIVVEHIIE